MVPRLCEDLLRRPDLRQTAEIHHRHAIADRFHDSQIVTDEEVGQAKTRFEVIQQVENLRLTETSSAETGSSRTISFGSAASARAMAIRWACLPENS